MGWVFLFSCSETRFLHQKLLASQLNGIKLSVVTHNWGVTLLEEVLTVRYFSKSDKRYNFLGSGNDSNDTKREFKEQQCDTHWWCSLLHGCWRKSKISCVQFTVVQHFLAAICRIGKDIPMRNSLCCLPLPTNGIHRKNNSFFFVVIYTIPFERSSLETWNFTNWEWLFTWLSHTSIRW